MSRKLTTIKARGSSKDLMDHIISKINIAKPTNNGGPMFNVERSTRVTAPRVKYLLRTGLKPFDDLIGGGLCFGRITEIYGLDTSGKTTLARVCVVQSQKREIYEIVHDQDDRTQHTLKQIGDDVEVVRLFLDNEQSIDRDAKMYFPDPDTGEPIEIDCILGDCDTVDQMFKIIDRTITNVAEWSKAKGKECLVVVVVDTIAGTASKEEISAEWGKDDYSRQPKQLREGFRRLSRRISRHNVMVICTNQVSEKYQKKAKGGSMLPQEGDFSASGGRALRYWASLRVFVFQLEHTYRLVRKSKFAAGYLIGFFVKKNRRVKPLVEGRLSLLFHNSRGFDPSFSVLESLIFLGLAEVSKTAPYNIQFKFAKWGIPMTTFEGARTGEDLDDDDKGRRKNPFIAERAEWPKFYMDHKADLDLMWERAREFAFTTEGLDMTVAKDDEDPDYLEDEDPDDAP